MPSELQRVARGLVDCFDEVPRVVDHLVRTAARCRENAQLALIASRGQATVAAQQLDAAARACEAAAHYLSMAPPKARVWAEGLVGSAGPGTNRPSSDSADRNKHLTKVAADNDEPLITVARKAFEAFRRQHEKDEQERDLPEEPLEILITVQETGELEFEERDEKEEKKREDRLLRDLEITTDLTEAVKTLLATMADEEGREWQQAEITITPDEVAATFTYPDREAGPEPVVIDIELPEIGELQLDDGELAMRPVALGDRFAPGVLDPSGSFIDKERRIAERLSEAGWRVDARPADHGSGQKNPDSMLRKDRDDPGVIVEFKTQDVGDSNAVKRNMQKASSQARKAAEGLATRREVVIDGRDVGLSEEIAARSFRRACGQPGTSVAPVVHVILGDGRLVTFTKEQ